MTKTEAIERMELEVESKRRRAEMLLEAKGPGSKEKHIRANEMMLDLQAMEMALSALRLGD